MVVMEYARVAAIRLIDSPNARSHLVSAHLVADPIRIISDRASGLWPTQSDDWHDMTGHHRYYGSAAHFG